ncbi:MAG: Sugar or nucleoside kinase, ribokinase family [Chloroflexi bacterium]|nr:MAG: Sugar or nucleoside kinase, ribokinase family [Chloroflexota bacterium]
MLNTNNKILVVGSVAYDSVETHAGKRVDALGGSASYFAIAASYFATPTVVAVVGEDFDRTHIEFFESRNIDLSGLQIKSGATFRWVGKYDPNNLNYRETIDTQLNVFAEFKPKLGAEHKSIDVFFLANIQPALQMEVLKQAGSKPKIVAMDSMNLWIENNKDDLLKLIPKTDILFLDETELRQLTGMKNLIEASKSIIDLGPRVVIVKKGEHGLLMISIDVENSFSLFACPALPVDPVIDPTGAGDSFAGGFMGHLASIGKNISELSSQDLRKAAVYGTIMGSFTVQGFSIEKLKIVSDNQIENRYNEFVNLTTIS